jgi:hypothetical protein
MDAVVDRARSAHASDRRWRRSRPRGHRSAALRVRDRSRHQLGEVGEARPTPAAAAPASATISRPEAPSTMTGAPTPEPILRRTAPIRPRNGKAEPGRTAGLEGERGEVLPAKGPPAASGEVVAASSSRPRWSTCRRAIATHGRIRRKQPTGLLNCREHSSGGSARATSVATRRNAPAPRPARGIVHRSTALAILATARHARAPPPPAPHGSRRHPRQVGGNRRVPPSPGPTRFACCSKTRPGLHKHSSAGITDSHKRAQERALIGTIGRWRAAGPA